eukprot:TRINITY_DN27104_c0_g1_i1.p1 TRINITY_DN27104_c0_g1~~TRINITY_DN27104_c0_g1_i1.p1  ORF type:complete len:819 (-),score=192.84 TRINITY_DN27104_c0_g1_i1:69-2525(-)
MEWAAGLEALSWAEVQPDLDVARGEEASSDATAPRSHSELLAVTPLPCSDPPQLASFVLKAQSAVGRRADMVVSEVLVQLSIQTLPGATSGRKSDAVTQLLRIEVPGYNVSAGDGRPFRQLLVSAGGRGLLLLAPRCCAAVALPEYTGDVSKEVIDLEAVPIAPCSEASFAKVSWHPLSDAHVGTLLSDGTWQLLNLSRRASSADPEVHFTVKFAGSSLEPGETVADFAFCCTPEVGAAMDSEAAWLSLSVLFMSSKGRLCVRNPVVPALAVLPSAALHALASSSSAGKSSDEGEASQWLKASLLRPGAQRDQKASDLCLVVRHRLHLHGGEEAEAYRQKWLPREQLIHEEREFESGPDEVRERQGELQPSSPRSPRHQRSTYCSVQLVSHSPVAVVARATTSGLVELLVLDGGLGPSFQSLSSVKSSERLACAVFEELDLMLAPAKVPMVRLSLAPPRAKQTEAGGQVSAAPVLLVRSRALVAAVELPWLASLISGKATLAGEGEEGPNLLQAHITTLAEVRKEEVIGGFQVVPAAEGSAAFVLRLQPAASPGAASTSLQAVGLDSALTAAAKTRSGKTGAGEAAASSRSRSASVSGLATLGAAAAAEQDEESLRRHLAAPLLLPSPLSSSGADAADLAKAIASVRGGQLAGLQARQQLLKHMASSLPARAEACKQELTKLRATGARAEDSAASLLERAEQGAARAATLRERQAGLVARQEKVVTALKAQLERRGLDSAASVDLPRLWARLHELRQACELMKAASASGQSSARCEASDLDLGVMQKTWAAAATHHLGLRAAEVEAVVAAASTATSQR